LIKATRGTKGQKKKNECELILIRVIPNVVLLIVTETL